jgi:hypothetical protein
MAEKTWLDYFTYFGSFVGILTAVYTFYKNFIEKAKVSIVPGDRMAIVRGPGGARRVHLRCALLNDAMKIGTLQRLEAAITGPGGIVQSYLWNQIFEFVPGTMNVQSAGAPLPIPIPGKDSRPLLVQLELVEPSIPANWTPGRHQIEVLGWVNRENRLDSPNATSVFHINIPSTLALGLPVDQPYSYEEIPIEEWSK